MTSAWLLEDYHQRSQHASVGLLLKRKEQPLEHRDGRKRDFSTAKVGSKREAVCRRPSQAHDNSRSAAVLSYALNHKLARLPSAIEQAKNRHWCGYFQAGYFLGVRADLLLLPY